MNIDFLQELGLTQREAEVYTSLLKLGEVPIAKLLKTTGAHPQVVYRAIDSLVAKKLVLVAQRKHRKYVKAEDPRILEQIEKDRLEELQQELPKLLALQTETTESIVRVHKGVPAVRRFRKAFVEDIAEGGLLRILGGSGDRFYQVMGETFPKIEALREKKRIRRQLISYRSQQAGLETRDSQTALVERRYFDEPFPVPASILVGDSFIGIFIWTGEPLAIQIENPEVVRTYRDHFDSLWKLAKP
ncbi:hypothetical protein HY375_00360 [Candidatus Berkelbacteria bacterium]|nr:hypothetical protein [Candidatus Berkelbacteria bacterium]